MTNLMAEIDLFGNQVTALPNLEEKKPFLDEEVAFMADELVDKSLQQFTDCLTSMRKEQGKNGTAITATRALFWVHLAWLYNLFASEAPLSFDSLCALRAINGDIIRARVSHEFAAEIRCFFAAYQSKEPMDAKRVALKLREYIDVQMTH